MTNKPEWQEEIREQLGRDIARLGADALVDDKLAILHLLSGMDELREALENSYCGCHPVLPITCKRCKALAFNPYEVK